MPHSKQILQIKSTFGLDLSVGPWTRSVHGDPTDKTKSEHTQLFPASHDPQTKGFNSSVQEVCLLNKSLLREEAILKFLYKGKQKIRLNFF